jgi:hypothetical protein
MDLEHRVSEIRKNFTPTSLFSNSLRREDGGGLTAPHNLKSNIVLAPRRIDLGKNLAMATDQPRPE